MSVRRANWIAALALAATLGCSGAPAPSGRASSTSSGSPVAGAAPLAAVNAQEPAGLRVELLGAEPVTPALLEVRLALVNRDPARPLPTESLLGGEGGPSGALARAFLASEDGSARYYVVRDANGKPACSDAGPPLDPGERRLAWARFAVPPAGGRMILHMGGLPPLVGISTTREQ